MRYDRAGGIGAGIGGALGAIAANNLEFGALTVGLTAGASVLLSYLTVYLLQKYQDR